METMTNVPSVSMEIKHSRHLTNNGWWLFDEIGSDTHPIRCCEGNVLIRKSQGTWCLYKHTSTLWLFWVIEERILIVVEATNDDNDQQDEDGHAPIHPIDQHQQQDGRTTYTPELPQQKGQHSANGLG